MAVLEDPTFETLAQALPSLQVGEGPCYVHSAYAEDFGNTRNEILVQDGSKEQDEFHLDFWEKVFGNQGCYDETCQKQLAVEQSSVLQSGKPVFDKENASASDTDNEVFQAQAYCPPEVKDLLLGISCGLRFATGGVAEVANITVLPLASVQASEDGSDISHGLETKLRLRSRTKCGIIDSDKHDSSLIAKRLPSWAFSFSLHCMVCVALITTLVVFFDGAW